MGLTFKEIVSDTRNSKVFDLIKALQAKSCYVEVYDPWLNEDCYDSFTYSGIDLNVKYDGIMIAVGHMQFINLGINILSLCSMKMV